MQVTSDLSINSGLIASAYLLAVHKHLPSRNPDTETTAMKGSSSQSLSQKCPQAHYFGEIGYHRHYRQALYFGEIGYDRHYRQDKHSILVK